ncbi:hypothetical protein RV17_GL002163 [Enterococcus thailandicus]|nr:hypothetical protein RV17_GL002163 [Enterococcus thailandicus]
MYAKKVKLIWKGGTVYIEKSTHLIQKKTHNEKFHREFFYR